MYSWTIGCLSHIGARSGRTFSVILASTALRKLYVSVISVQTVVQASHSYPPKRLISRLTHTGLDWIGLAHSYLNVLHNIKASLLAAFKYLKIPFSPGRPRHPPIYFIFYIFTSINHSFFWSVSKRGPKAKFSFVEKVLRKGVPPVYHVEKERLNRRPLPARTMWFR